MWSFSSAITQLPYHPLKFGVEGFDAKATRPSFGRAARRHGCGLNKARCWLSQAMTSYALERFESSIDVPGRLKMKSFPMIAAGVQQPGGNPSAIKRSTMARELATVRE
jgi:hypothetical protein